LVHNLARTLRKAAGQLRGDGAQDAVEYSLIVGVVTLVIIFAFVASGMSDAMAEVSSDVISAIWQ
jgi:Flp pilus assembly pilin Flp